MPVRVLVIRLAEAFHQLPVADLPDAVKADVRHVGNLPRDFRNVPDSGKIARRHAHHLAILELAQLCQRGPVITRLQMPLHPGSGLFAQTLFPPGKRQQCGFERAQPVGMRNQQIAQCLGTAEQGGENAGLFGGAFFQDASRIRGAKELNEMLGPLRACAGLDALSPNRIFHNTKN